MAELRGDRHTVFHRSQKIPCSVTHSKGSPSGDDWRPLF
jgi:hypothetical protein